MNQVVKAFITVDVLGFRARWANMGRRQGWVLAVLTGRRRGRRSSGTRWWWSLLALWLMCGLVVVVLACSALNGCGTNGGNFCGVNRSL